LKAVRKGIDDLAYVTDSAQKSLKEKGNENPTQAEMSAEIKDLQKDYQRMEGFAEFVTAWVKNPLQAREMAPKTFEKFQEAILSQPNGEKRWEELEKVSYETRIWYNLNSFDRARSTKKESIVEVKDMPFWKKQKMKLDEFLNTWGIKKVNGEPTLSYFDLVQIVLSNDKKAMKISMGQLFMKTETDANFYLLTRLMAGQNDKCREMLEGSGIREIKFDKDGNIGYEKVTDNGEAMTIGWLLAPLSEGPNFEKASKKDRLKQLDSDKQIAEEYMTAQRTIELFDRFKKEAEEKGEVFDENKAISGMGGDTYSTPDIEAARQHMAEYNELHDEATKKRIGEFMRRYRAMADQTMQYAMKSGLISEETYNKIKENNQYYVALHRVFEDEIDQIGDATGGYLQGQQPTGDAIKKIKGSAADRGDAIENLIATFYGTINRADQNYINGRFVSLLEGDGSTASPLKKT
jgi:hypothetical protein